MDRQGLTMHECPNYCGKQWESKAAADRCCDPDDDRWVDRGRE
jgi:hypothetical protein